VHGGLPGVKARAIDIDAHGHVWIGTEGGIAVLYSNGRVLATYGVIDGLSHALIKDLTIDRGTGRIFAISEESEDSNVTSLNVFESGFEPLPADPEDAIFVYPNPWNASEATKSMEEAITFFGVREGSTVHILDVTGQELRELRPTEPYTWDTLDDSLNELPSGLYIARIETPGGSVVFRRVAIVR
jgi:hypothetical protein